MASEPMTVSKNLGTDLGTTGGDWLFRQGELVLGPVPAHRIVDKLFSGELSGGTEISLLGDGHFMRLSEVDFFKLHLAKAEAKLRVDAVAQAERARSGRKRNVRIGIVAAASLLFAGGAAMVARYLAIHKPWKNADDLAFANITVEPPTITLAQAGASREEWVDYPGRGTAKPVRKSADRFPERARGSARAKVGDEEPDGLQTAQFDREAINTVVSAKQKTLYACLAEEVKKRPGFSAKIPIEFVIGNDGRVSKLWVDHPALKDGPLTECMLRELQKWPFKPYPGEQATVGLSFKVGKGG